MMDTAQLEKEFALYFTEIQRCIDHKCYWALLHILLTIPDVCATLEISPVKKEPSKVGDRYVVWCNIYFPSNTNISGKDRYQMRCALLHSGSTTAGNLGNKSCAQYKYFSYVTPDEFDVQIHGSASFNHKILNIHPVAMAQETIDAIHKWFIVLQGDKIKMGNVSRNINTLSRLQPKKLQITKNGSILSNGTTMSST